MPSSDDSGAICRACGEFASRAADRCGSCHARNLLIHDEISVLSIAHIDCDAFYAAVEKRDRPDLEDRPVIVGGGKRGVVTTCCYIARTYGVRSAMPMFKALAACPDAVVIRPDFEKYTAVSREIRTRMLKLTPLVEPVSIDEAFLDLSGTALLHKSAPAQALIRFQSAIAREVGVSVSIGLSYNKFLAKLASDLDKPSGFSVIGQAEAPELLSVRSVSSIMGIGPASEARLNSAGLRTIGDIQRASLLDLYGICGEQAVKLREFSLGIDTRKVTPERVAKSIASETTFEDNIADAGLLEARLWELCEQVAKRMKAQGVVGRVATVKLTRSDFHSLTRRATLGEASNLARIIFAAARPLLAKQIGPSFRLIGIGMSGLEPSTAQAQRRLFDTAEDRIARQESAIDRIREKFGDEAIAPGLSMRIRRN